MTIRRAFADLPHGQVHYRQAGEGEGATLLLIHASPGSSRQLVPLMESLSGRFRLIAPDTPGNGDSVQHPLPEPHIADYARLLPALLDALNLDRVHIYGSHTGAAIAAELAIQFPDRVGRIILDGIGVFTAAEQEAHLAHYAKPFEPDFDGAYLMRAFHFCRDQYLFFPWYDRCRSARRDSGLRDVRDMHAWLVEVLKAAETYQLAYRASFIWNARERLPLLRRAALVMAAADDPLLACTRDVFPLIPGSTFDQLPRFDDPAFAAERASAIKGFLKD